MNIIEHGVSYSVENFDKSTGNQIISFTSKNNDGTFNPGTTNEEIIDMMIDRFHALNKKNFSAENQCAILLLKNIRQMLKRRLSKKIDKVVRYNDENGK